MPHCKFYAFLSPPFTVQQPPGFEKLKPGQSRPILKGDLKTIESQLARHQLNEQKAKAKKLQREDPFHANPWDNSLAARHDSSALVDSTISTNEEFYSLDLAHSFSGSISTHMTQSVTQMEDSFISTMSRVSSQDTYGGYRASSTVTGRSEHSTTSGGGGHIYGRSIASDLESIPLHEGVGLQQLSLSPPFQTPQYHHSSPNHYHQASGSGGMRGSRATGNSGGVTSFTPVGYNSSSPPMPRGSSTRIGTDGGGSLLSSAPSESGTQASTAAHRKQHPYAAESHDQDVCRYSFAISGITLALLEADPMHTHCTPATQYYSSSPPATVFQKSPSPPSQSSSPRNSSSGLSSVDEGGLDPMKYFETVSVLLEGGINRKVLQNKQEELSQVLPNDHLL